MTKSKFIPPLPPVRTNEVAFPKPVVDAISTAAHHVAAQTFAAHAAQPAEFSLLKKPTITDPVISLQDSKAMIVEALHDFDPVLGAKAAAMLQNEKTLNISDVPAGTAYMMRCRPAGYTNPGEENSENHPIIDFDYDHTIQSTIYLAHELGHAIADDYQREAGHDFETNPTHMIETQAYLVQNIVYNHLKDHPDKNIATAAERYAATEMARNIYDLSLAHAAQDALQDIAQHQEPNPAMIFENRFGQGWENFISTYAPAQRIFETMATLKADPQSGLPEKMETLQNEAQRLHERPTSILIAACIAKHLETEDIGQRRKTSEILLGRHGPKDITSTLQSVGLHKEGRLDSLAQSTMQYLTQRLNATPDAQEMQTIDTPKSRITPSRHTV